MPRKQEDGVCVHALATHTISQQMSMVPRRFPSSLGGSLAGEAVTFLTSGEITCIKEGGPLSLCQQCNEWALRSPRVVTAVGRRCGVPWVALFSFTSSFHLRLPPYYFRFLSEGERLEDFIMYRYDTVRWRPPRSSAWFFCLCGAVVMATIFVDTAFASNRDALVMAFTERFTRTTGESLYELWHSDCHRRCRSQLIGHVTLACQFDPYKVTRRTLSKRDVNSTIAHLISDIEQTNSPFLARSAAASFLNKQSGRLSSLHKIHKRGIMDECCYTKSCSWEEYAEFCHSHNRRPAYRDTQCYP